MTSRIIINHAYIAAVLHGAPSLAAPGAQNLKWWNFTALKVKNNLVIRNQETSRCEPDVVYIPKGVGRSFADRVVRSRNSTLSAAAGP